MKSIRFGTFETNSSSAHALIYTALTDFKKFVNGDMVLQMGAWGVPESYLIGRGCQENGGYDGKLLTWEQARDLYVECLRGEKYFKKQYLQLLRYHVRKDIRKPDDITPTDFRKAVEWGDDKDFSNGIIFGTWFTHKQWVKRRPDEYGMSRDTIATQESDKVKLDFWWFAG